MGKGLNMDTAKPVSTEAPNLPDQPTPSPSSTVLSTPPSPRKDAASGLEPSKNESDGFNIKIAKSLDIRLFPHQPIAGSRLPPATIPNVNFMLSSYGINVRYCVIRKKIEIIIPGLSGTTDNLDNVTLTHIMSLSALNGLPVGQIPAYIEALADQNQYNPVAEWITSKPWDGTDRLPEIYDTITAREGYPAELKQVLMRKWLLSTVAAALMPREFKARGVLTLQGPQGIGKTRWVMSLVPNLQLREMAVKIDHHLDGNNKDSILGAVSHWLVEIGELDSSFKKDIARLKGFLTSDYDKVRRPYARTESEYPRRTVFFASVNQSDFLVDSTGNTRWWTIPVTEINYEHGIDMQQLFAQLAVDFRDGKQWWLSHPEQDLLESCNMDHRTVSVIRERLMAIIDLELIGKDGNPAMTALEVLTKLEFEYPTNQQCRECASILREVIGESKKIRGSHKWRIPLRRFKVHYVTLDDPADEGT